jgi:hypothetical protein
MKLTEDQEKEAAKNRQFMRHMTLSFWGFIIIAVLSLFVWTKVEKWMSPTALLGEASFGSKANVQLMIHPEDEEFWVLSKPEMAQIIASWKTQGVSRVWVPLTIQSVPFFKSKALKYALDTAPRAVEYEWYQKATFPQINDILMDEEIAIGGYFWYAPTQRTNTSFEDFSSKNWFIPNTPYLDTETDSVTTYLKALADESIVSWNLDAFAMVTEDLSNTGLLLPEKKLLSNALQRHQYPTQIYQFTPEGDGFESTYMSISKWVSLSNEQRSDILKLPSTFLVLGSKTSSVILY